MRPHHFIFDVERVVSGAISGCYPRYWKEDHISMMWLKKLLDNFRRFEISPPDNGALTYRVALDAFKVDGSLEKKYGDIAVLVKLTFRNDRSIEGVGFLEAKPVFNTPSDLIRPLQYWIVFFGCNHFWLKNGAFWLRKGLKPSIQRC